MSYLPRNSLTLIRRSNIVLYMSAEVPEYQGTIGRKSGFSSNSSSDSTLPCSLYEGKLSGADFDRKLHKLGKVL